MIFFLSDDKEEDLGGCYSSVYGKSSVDDKEMEDIDGDGGGKMPADELLNKSSEGAFFYIIVVCCHLFCLLIKSLCISFRHLI